MHLPHDPDQVIGKRRFEYVRGRTGFQSAMDVFIASVHGQHDDPRVRGGFADRGDRLETADTGQVGILVCLAPGRRSTTRGRGPACASTRVPCLDPLESLVKPERTVATWIVGIRQ